MTENTSAASLQGVPLFANLDFEQEWAAHIRGQRYQRKRVMASVCQRWSHILRLLEGQSQGPLMWGLTPSVWAALPAEQQALVPSLESVQRVNGKDFSHELEQRLGIALPHACLVSSEDELAAALAACPYAWVLKHPWGVSGRDQLRGDADHIDNMEERHRRWVQRQLQHGDVLVFEPWMQRKLECSLHFDVTAAGEVHDVGVCLLMTGTHDGTYRGNTCGPHVTAPDGAWDVGREVARAVAQEGYFGPIGIDVMVGALDGAPRLRPLMEINARVSFGRLALALAQHVPEGRAYSWLHKAARETTPSQSLEPISPDGPTKGNFRLPEHADPGGRSGTWLQLGMGA